MNAGSFAELLDARRCGPGRWMARCPPHQDRTPSLQIAQGDKDVLLHCWTGCSIEEVCTALGLRLHDLFDDRDLSPAERRGASQERQERDVEHLAAHRSGCQRNRDLYRMECLRDAMGEKLARLHDDDRLTELFHLTCDRLEDAEAAMPGHADGPNRQQPSMQAPAWITRAGGAWSEF